MPARAPSIGVQVTVKADKMWQGLEDVKKNVIVAADVGTFNFSSDVRKLAMKRVRVGVTSQLRRTITNFGLGGGKIGYVVRSGVVYGAVYEWGRRPGFIVPERVITDTHAGLAAWVMRRRLRLPRRPRGSGRRSAEERRDAAIDVARLVALKIYRKGIKKRPFMGPAVADARGARGLQVAVQDAIAQALR